MICCDKEDEILQKPCPANYAGAGVGLLRSFFNDPKYGVIAKYEKLFPAPTGQDEFTYNAPGYQTGVLAGLSQVLSGTTLFGGTATFEHNKEVLTFPIVLFGMVMIYNLPGFLEPLKLTAENIADIYKGVITTWNDKKLLANNPALTNIPNDIISIARSDGCASTYTITHYLKKALKKFRPVGIGPFPVLSSGTKDAFGLVGGVGSTIIGPLAMIAAVTATPYSIGYVGYEFLIGSTLGQAQILNTTSRRFIQPSVNSIELAGVDIKIRSDLVLNLLNTKNPEGYPITSVANVVVLRQQPKRCVVANLQNFLYFLATTGQLSANSLNFGRLSHEVVCRYIKQLCEIYSIAVKFPLCCEK